MGKGGARYYRTVHVYIFLLMSAHVRVLVPVQRRFALKCTLTCAIFCVAVTERVNAGLLVANESPPVKGEIGSRLDREVLLSLGLRKKSHASYAFE